MSTRLLSVQGKIHELNDDLESHFFVLLYEGLHFVKHNKPHGISLGDLFDQVTVDPETGHHRGGQGKVFLYTTDSTTMEEQLKFTSKPFTTLIRGLYRLFASLHWYNSAKDTKRNPVKSDAKNVKKLEDCVGIAKLFDQALKSKEWPTKCDKALDQYPPSSHLKPQQKVTVAMSYFNQSPATEPSSGKRKRGTEGEARRPRRDKRSKADKRQ